MPWPLELTHGGPGALAGSRARLPSPYTVRDAPEVVRRIEGDLALVVRAVRAADPALRALVLTGGFARGEGAVLDGAPLNDYDLVALRGVRPPRLPYARLKARLEARLGLHLDLQPVRAARLPLVRPSIFWHETALRGRVLWGDAALLGRIPARVRDPRRIPPSEGPRLLVNRAAGLLLAWDSEDPLLLRIQAAKGLLAAMDARLLAAGRFAPSQRERWALREALVHAGEAPLGLEDPDGWLAWGFAFKVDPASAGPRDPREARERAALGILGALGPALAAAGHRDLEAYARADGWLENVHYRAVGAGRVPGARRWAANPTGRVRAATLEMLADALEGWGDAAPSARRHLARVVRLGDGPGATLAALAAMRAATLQ